MTKTRTKLTHIHLPLTASEVAKLIDEVFPEAREQVGAIEIVRCGDGAALLRLPYRPQFARPGGTISGPTMFQLADMGCYVAILSDLGHDAIAAVTTTLTINFLSRPRPEDLICEVEVLRRGRRQIVCDARIFSSTDRLLVAQSSCIYALPASPAS
jgi:uncharacterized protein (TIGR00369 family)